ncbi:LysR substrate-binding domain-containing protein [Novosphingobium bradum]|uniref:LysR substrate-binding domain-containing protein n=1 Tax=Novosphingobium bradum TaxID=1737444 RepID=A0ABV7INC9_9SPHN
MDLRHMRHFVAVAEELHFGRAAQRLNMAQPPLSQSIRRLEAYLGVELLNRAKGGVSVSITPAGLSFLAQARRTLMQAEFATTMARRAAAGAADVRVSFVGPALYRVLPELVVNFREVAPSTQVHLFERSSAEQTAGLLAGELDVGIVIAGTTSLEGLEQRVIQRKPMVAAIPAGWPLAAQPSVTLAQLAAQPFIQPPQKYLEQAAAVNPLQARGYTPVITQEAAQVDTVLSLVGAGLGCSIVMGTACDTRLGGIVFLPISDLVPVRRSELVMIWQAEQMSEAKAMFIEAAGAYVAATPSLLDDSFLRG